jgi:hypothetical protein
MPMTAEPGLAGEMFGKMDRIVIARQFGETDHVLVFHRLQMSLAHADREVFEEAGSER